MEQNSLIVFLGIFREKPFGNRGFLSLRSAQSSTKTKKFPVIFPASSELDLENGFAWLRPPPPSLAEPCIFPSGSSRPFVPGFPLSVLRRFSLCGSSLFLSAIFAWSPHPKIPFLADKALAGGCGFVGYGSVEPYSLSWPSGESLDSIGRPRQ